MTNPHANMKMARYESVERAAMWQEVTHPVDAYRDQEAFNRLWERIEEKRRNPSPSPWELQEWRGEE